MPRSIHCPQCNAEFTTFLRPGERVVCKRCGYELLVPPAAPEASLEAARADLQHDVESRETPPSAEELEVERLVELGKSSPPTAALYDVPAVGVGTFFGGILGGAILASKNYLALGDEEAARRSIWYGIGATVLLFTILLLIPDHVRIPNSVFHALQIATVFGLVMRAQGARITAHTRLGGPLQSKWRAAGIGLMYGLLQAGILFGALPLIGMLIPLE